MKKIWISALILLTYISVNAQFVYGPSAGIDVTSLSVAKSSSLGIHGGVFLKAEIFDRIGIQPEVLFAYKRGSTTEENVEISYSGKFVEVPILFFFPLSDHLTAQIGPQIVSAIGGNEDTKIGSTTTTKSMTFNGGGGFIVGIQTNLISDMNFSLRFSKTDEVSTVGACALYTIDW